MRFLSDEAGAMVIDTTVLAALIFGTFIAVGFLIPTGADTAKMEPVAIKAVQHAPAQ